MANTNYNAFTLMIVSEQYQIIGLNPDGTTTTVSNENFAYDVSISEDGTLWAISLEPDPDGGGGKIYYSQSPNDWHEITTSDPGALAIAGGKGSSCFFIDGTARSIYLVKTDGTAVNQFSERRVYEIGAGGGKIWALYGPNHDGDIPKLFYSNWQAPFNFVRPIQSDQDVSPRSLSVDLKGNCYCTLYDTPWMFKHDKSGTGAVAELVDNQVEKISKKNDNYILTYDANDQGNQILQMGGPGGQAYNYNPINHRAMNIVATFYQKDA